MKRIGYVLSAFPVRTETFVVTEMRAMRRRGHDTLALVLGDVGDARDCSDPALCAATRPVRAATVAATVAALCSRGLWSALGFAWSQRRIARASLLWHGARLAALARAAGCAHLHAHFAHAAAAHAIVAARLAGISVSFVGHGFDVYCAPADLGAKLAHADFALAVCADMQRTFHDVQPGACTAVVHCGVELERFAAASMPGEHAGRLLFIGRLVPKKGIDLLLEALARLPAAVRPGLDLVGDGPLRQALENLCRERGLAAEVRFLGPRTHDWIAANCAGYLALVAPFRCAADGDRDTGPVVVKEAMAFGMPVIASRFMGLREIVADGETGLLFAVDDAPGLAQAILSLCALPAPARLAMGSAGRERVARLYDADRLAVRFSALVEAA